MPKSKETRASVAKQIERIANDVVQKARLLADVKTAAIAAELAAHTAKLSSTVESTADSRVKEMKEISSQTFDLLMARFDTLEGQNKDQIDLLEKHIDEDQKVHKIVERHSAYFGILSFGVPAVMAFIGSKLGLKIN